MNKCALGTPLRPLSLKVRTRLFQSRNAEFESRRGHCGYSTMASTADCGSAYDGSIPSGHIWAGKSSGEDGRL